MSDIPTPKPSDERNGSFLDSMWCCKVCDGEIPDGHTDSCYIWQLEKKHRDFIANEYNTALTKRDELQRDLTLLTAERDRLASAIRWALGEEGNFGEEPPPLAGKYRRRYWWRSELRRRAALAQQDTQPPPTEKAP